MNGNRIKVLAVIGGVILSIYLFTVYNISKVQAQPRSVGMNPEMCDCAMINVPISKQNGIILHCNCHQPGGFALQCVVHESMYASSMYCK